MDESDYQEMSSQVSQSQQQQPEVATFGRNQTLFYESQPATQMDSMKQEDDGIHESEADRKKIVIPEPLLRYMNGSKPDVSNKNKHITDEFERLVKRAEAEGNHWRIRAYKKAVKILSKLETRIMSVEDAKGIPGIGPSMREKIGEILKTGFSLKAHTIPEKFGPLEIFKNIYG
ncbi:UNVERIFIED_CONTAM: hypothetical protein HDU68_002055, partial [Siphonaria sp. JEL0065]